MMSRITVRPPVPQLCPTYSRAGLVRGAQDGVESSTVIAMRLLEEHGRARLQGGAGEFRVGVVGGEDEDGVDAVVVEQCAMAGDGGGAGEPVRDGREHRRVGVRDGGDDRTRRPGCARQRRGCRAARGRRHRYAGRPSLAGALLHGLLVLTAHRVARRPPPLGQISFLYEESGFRPAMMSLTLWYSSSEEEGPLWRRCPRSIRRWRRPWRSSSARPRWRGRLG